MQTFPPNADTYDTAGENLPTSPGEVGKFSYKGKVQILEIHKFETYESHVLNEGYFDFLCAFVRLK